MTKYTNYPPQVCFKIQSNKIFIICGQQIVTYAQFFDAVGGVIDYFQSSGIKSKDRVGICCANSVEYVAALIALWRIGTVACLLSPRLPQEALQQQCSNLSCQNVLTSFPEVPYSDKLTETNPKWSLPVDQEATIMFTSGSSASPKAVLHTIGNHYFSAKGANVHIPLVAGDRWLLTLPLHHVGGLSILFRALLAGATLVIPEKDEPIEAAIRRYGITHVSMVPTQIYRLLGENEEGDLKSLKAILVGGGPIPEALLQKAMEKGFPVHTTYGLTEMASQVATSNVLTSETISNGGRVLEDREVNVSEEGEILVRGKTLFQGYVEGGHIDCSFDAGGWFATGDLGELNDEGYLKVTGRKDNMFISGGENIQPEEIERHLCRLEGVEEAIVIPVEHAEFGFRPVAFIKYMNGKSITSEEIKRTLQQYLPKFKIPDTFYDWPEGIISEGIKPSRLVFKHYLERTIPRS